MDTKKLELLLETIQYGSMKRAAEQLDYTQSGLVYMLNSLEEELGVPLLNRNFRGVSLTPEGKLLEPYIRQIVDNTHLLEEKSRTLISEKNKELYIGAYPAIARNVLPDVSGRFMQLHPEINIHIYSGMEELSSWLENDDINLGICEHGIAGQYKWIPLFRDEVWVAVPSDGTFPENTPVSLDDLLDYTVLMPSHNPKSAGNTELFQWASSRNKIKNLEIKAPDGSVQLSMVSRGLGITFLSSLYRYECLPSAQMLPLMPPIYREVGCILKEERQLTPYMKEFISFLKEYSENEFSDTP